MPVLYYGSHHPTKRGCFNPNSMAYRFDEYYAGNTGITLEVERILCSRHSDYQKIEVIETPEWGKVLILDGMIMLSERDEFVYHEMIVHPALSVHPDPQKVLIIGGGDGGTAREVLRHPEVVQVDLIEIDAAVIDTCRKYFPGLHCFDHPKLKIIEADGASFVQQVSNKTEYEYDIIIVDGSDPVGPAKVLFGDDFFENSYQILTKEGLFVCQSESPWVEKYQPVISEMYQSLDTLYRFTDLYLCAIPLYPTGLWSMMMASKTVEPRSETAIYRVGNKYTNIGQNLNYFNPEIYRASFALPGFVEDLIK